MKLINNVIRKLGKSDYSIDKEITKKEIAIIVIEKFTSLIRGYYMRLWVKSSKGLLFVGRNCKLKHLHKLNIGKTIIIGDNVEINALSRGGVHIGDNVSIHRNTIIECTGVIKELGEGIIIGNNVGFAPNCFIQVRGSVKIGSNVMFGPGASIFSENHGFGDTDIPMIMQPTKRFGVTIEDDVWIGTKAVILDGVTVGKGSIIAAGAIVNKDIAPFSIVAGIPGKVIGSRLK
ncbi:MAG: acyltransferase [Flavobacterium sp.]|nr:MAG: acyltransferase [Flavobacterium sp.]